MTVKTILNKPEIKNLPIHRVKTSDEVKQSNN